MCHEQLHHRDAIGCSSTMRARQHDWPGGAGDRGILGYPPRPEAGGVVLSTCHRPDQRTPSNLTANSTRHLPDWPAQNVCKMLIALCGCFSLTEQFFDLTSMAVPTRVELERGPRGGYPLLLVADMWLAPGNVASTNRALLSEDQ